MFLTAVSDHLLSALAAGAHRGEVPGRGGSASTRSPTHTRSTWSFAQPDGRALFIIERGSDGGPMLTWIAIGYHDIYD